MDPKAFPRIEERWNNDRGDYELASTEGMSLRDYFAAKAMQAMLSTLSHALTTQECIVISEDAYVVADEMLKARAA